MKIGVVKFLNAIPFTGIPYELTYDLPSKLNLMLKQKKLDVAFASSATYFQGEYDYLPGLCLAARGKIGSVHLYLPDNKKIESSKIYLDPASNTGNALFMLLVKHYWKTKVQIVPTKEKSEGFILIGDSALYQPHILGYRTFDLASLWYEMTSLPFVFALFIKQKGLDTQKLEADLSFSLERFINRFPQNIEKLAATYQVAYSQLFSYFKNCYYRLGEKEKAGLKLFEELYSNELYEITAKDDSKLLF